MHAGNQNWRRGRVVKERQQSKNPRKSQFQLRPSPPPGNCGAFACLVSPGGGALANLARPGGRAFAYPRAFDTHVVSDSKSKHEGFYRKGPAVRRRLDRLPRTGQTCGGFLDFMHFFIDQGTTIT